MHHDLFNNKNQIIFRWRLLFYLIVSLFIIASDVRFGLLIKIQNYLDHTSFFLHFLSNIPNQWLTTILQSLKDNQKLILENHSLKKKLSLKNSEFLLMEYYKEENKKLRELLSSPLLHNEKKILTNIISKKINPYSAQIIIDKGSDNGVYIGQPVINDKGIIGQIIATNRSTSRVLLICDNSHALPVQILRNNVRMILQGNGYKKNLEIKHIPNNNIKIGDILITSGLGGRFPIGYPVATITSITNNKKTGYTTIEASPIANLDHLSYLLLLWNMEEYIQSPLSPDRVHTMSNKRLNKHKMCLKQDNNKVIQH